MEQPEGFKLKFLDKKTRSCDSIAYYTVQTKIG